MTQATRTKNKETTPANGKEERGHSRNRPSRLFAKLDRMRMNRLSGINAAFIVTFFILILLLVVAGLQAFDAFGQRKFQSTILVLILALSCAASLGITLSLVAREHKRKTTLEKGLMLSRQNLQEKIKRLTFTNDQLQQFASVASHDMQEPLRKILTYNERIHKKFYPLIDSDLKNYLDKISKAAIRMQVLIDDILCYTRTSKNNIEKKEIDLNEVIEIVKENYEVTIQKRRARIIFPERLPHIMGDKTQIILLFQNLISNAIKFTNPDVQPRIELFYSTVQRHEIGGEIPHPDHDEYYRITIKDNGIGIDEAYLTRIFVIFQRLNGKSDFDGTGIGLSICKKIVENHGGSIKAESEKNAGSSFSVVLPKPSKNSTYQLKMS